MIFGVIGTYFNLTGWTLMITGMFMAFTYNGTKIDEQYCMT